jgi:ABC-type Na+ transport system ATPase subunit NatA
MTVPAIAIHDLTKRYGKARGIEHVSLEIGEGEIFGFIGPNGAGKSTTIRILLNLIFPTSGSATIMGMDVIRETRKIKRQVGYIPSDAGFYPSMDVHEFLSYCLRFYPGQAGDNRIEKLSEYFELDMDRKIEELSMGNRRKVAIVQSLLHKPKLLILDEPTTGLDALQTRCDHQGREDRADRGHRNPPEETTEKGNHRPGRKVKRRRLPHTGYRKHDRRCRQQGDPFVLGRNQCTGWATGAKQDRQPDNRGAIAGRNFHALLQIKYDNANEP